jgi:hypothetical protein
VPLHAPGQVFADLAVAIADGADAVTGIGVLRDRDALFGPVASMPTAWRLLDRIDKARLPRVRAARAAARERAWQAGAAPEAGTELRIDSGATISIAHSEKQNAAATWKASARPVANHPWRLDRWLAAGGAAACRVAEVLAWSPVDGMSGGLYRLNPGTNRGTGEGVANEDRRFSFTCQLGCGAGGAGQYRIGRSAPGLGCDGW